MFNLIYLHGFASSPLATKARMFSDAFTGGDVHLVVPDLNVPDFSHLTLTAMLERIAETVRDLPDGDTALIGSSMGGLAAIHFLDRYREAEAKRISKLVLLAPAFDFYDNRVQQLGADGLARWQAEGTMNYFNFAHNQLMPVHYGLVEDMRQYDSYGLLLDLPILIFHGLHDETVSYEQSIRFATNRPNVDLRLLESDHSLIDAMAEIIAAVRGFLVLS